MLENLEELAERYAQLKEQEEKVELARVAVRLVDAISSSSFAFPLKEEALSNNGTTTYTYKSDFAYPSFFEFLAELLHTKVPVEVEGAKFGPGEILVSKESRDEADIELALAIKELQKLVHARRAEIFSKYAGAAP